MTIFVRGDVIEVPFPADEADAAGEPKTAVVVSPIELAQAHGLIWVVLVTKDDAQWLGDVAIIDAASAGVPPRSIIRTAKLATVPAQGAKRIGRIPLPLLASVIGQLNRQLGRV